VLLYKMSDCHLATDGHWSNSQLYHKARLQWLIQELYEFMESSDPSSNFFSRNILLSDKQSTVRVCENHTILNNGRHRWLIKGTFRTSLHSSRHVQFHLLRKIPSPKENLSPELHCRIWHPFVGYDWHMVSSILGVMKWTFSRFCKI